MAATFRLTAAPTFPEGTTVSAYDLTLWGGPPPAPGLKPPIAAAASAVVDAHGYAELTGLIFSRHYAAGAIVAGSWRYVTFTTPDEPAGTGGGGGGTIVAVGEGLEQSGGIVTAKPEVEARTAAVNAERARAETAEAAARTAAEAASEPRNAVAAERTRAEGVEATKVGKNSPALEGTPTAPSAAPGTNTTQLATTAFAHAGDAAEQARAEGVEATKAPLASPKLTGTPEATAPPAKDNSTKIATTAFTQTTVGEARTAAEAASEPRNAVPTEKARAEAAEALLQPKSQKEAGSGYAGLDSGAKVPVARLPVMIPSDIAVNGQYFQATGAETGEWNGKPVTKDTIVVNAADHGLKLDGLTDDGPALNALIEELAAAIGAEGSTEHDAAIFLPPGAIMALGTQVTRRSRVSIVGPQARVVLTSSFVGSSVFTNSTAAPLVASHVILAAVDKVFLTGTLFDTHSMQHSIIDVRLLTHGFTGTNLLMKADAKARSSFGGDASANAAGNWIHLNDRGTCGNGVVLQGEAVGSYAGATEPSVVTLNTFHDCHHRGILKIGWDLNEWCDDNRWTGNCTNSVKEKNAIVLRNNGSATPAASVGVYCNTFDNLTAENYAPETGCKGILLNYQRGLVVRNYFADPGFESGAAVVDEHSQSHYIERIGKHGSNKVYVYQKGVYAGVNDEAGAEGPKLELLKQRADGNAVAEDFLGEVRWWGRTNNISAESEEREQARLRAKLTDATNGKEKVEVHLLTRSSGTLAGRYRFSDDGRLGIGNPTFAGLTAALMACSPAATVPAAQLAGNPSGTAAVLELWKEISAGGALSSKLLAALVGGGLELAERSEAPATPAAGFATAYLEGKSLKVKTSDGTVHTIF